MRLKNVPFIVSTAIVVHFAGMLLVARVLHARSFPLWMENGYMFGFLAPEMIWCRPWTPVLEKLGLMEGGWWRMPSLRGLALVNSMYVLGLCGIGLIMRRGRS